MATFSVTDQTRRAQYTANGSTTEFSFSFQVNNTSDIKVYIGTTLKTESTHYDIKTTANANGLNTDGTGKVVFRTSPSDYTPANNEVVSIISDLPLSRTSVYTSGGNITAASLENDFDTLTMILAAHEERIDRVMTAPVDDAVAVDLTLPNATDRASKIVAFDTNGDLSMGTSSSLELTLDTVDINTITTNLIDGVGGDLIIKPFGSQVNIVGTSGEQRITFSAVTSPTMTMFSADGNSIGLALPAGNPTAARTIRFPDADGNVALTNQNTLTPTGDFTVDASGDIILDADGAQVYFKDAGTTNFTFNLGSVPQIQANGTGLMIQNSSSSIDFKAASGLYEFLSSTGDQVVQLHGNTSDPAIKFYKTSNTLKLNAPSSITGTRTITLPDASGSVMLNVVEDTSPQLGGNLDLNGRRIQDDTQVYIEGTNTADIELQAAGGQVNILGTAGQQRITFDNAATPSMDTYGAFSIDGNDTITINSTGDFTVDSSGDIILDADGGEIYLKDGGTTKFTFRVSAAGERITSAGGLEIIADNGGDIMLQPQGGQVMLLGTSGEQRMNLNNDATPSIQIYQNSNNLTLAVATLTATRTLTLPDATDTLVGKATTDTLTNKTLTSAVLNTGVSGTAVLDEDNMASNSATQLATQQSIKAYVDANAGSGDLNNVLTSGNTTGGVNILFGDSDKAIFGAGSDLQIYHNGSHSIIADVGTGNLNLYGENLNLQNSDGTENYIRATANSDVKLYYDNGQALATTSEGVNVGDGLTGTKTIALNGGGSSTSVMNLDFLGGGSGNPSGRIGYSSATEKMSFYTGDLASIGERIVIDQNGKVGVGLNNPADYYGDNLVVSAPPEGGITIASTTTSGTNYLMFADGTSGTAAYRGYVGYSHNSPENMLLVSYGYMRFYTSADGSTATERWRIEENGNLKAMVNGIGIDFSASEGSSASSSVLDDYEEGTWTPTFLSSIPITVNSSTVANKYAKVGRIIHVTFDVTVGTTSSSTHLGINSSSLPFSTQNYSSALVGWTDYTTKPINLLVTSSGIQFYQDGNSTISAATLSGKRIIGSATYFTS